MAYARYSYRGISLTRMKAKLKDRATTGMAKIINQPGETRKKSRNNAAPPMAIKMNCLIVKGPIIFSSVSINCGTWNLICFLNLPYYLDCLCCRDLKREGLPVLEHFLFFYQTFAHDFFSVLQGREQKFRI